MDYDIAEAFENIEDELISSMMRNFSKHRVEENDNNFCWSQWQAEELKSLEQYRKSNAKKFNKQFSEINSKISQMLRTARAEGNASQEASILKAIKNGFKVPTRGENKSTGEFFKLNDRKLDALIKSTTDDLKRAETAILRMSNDKYRKAIYNAQVYCNTGAGTYEKAVDMACKDMLNAGLNCVEYKNGARHTLSDYADMALKTANKRAYLRGEGEKRTEWGISTVVVNSRQGGCPLCAEYIGKVFIDDVYSNGKQSDGNYPLLSTAIQNGLFHPRCKDSTSTYYEGISECKPVSKEELAEMERREQLEQKQQYANRQTQRFKRRAKYSLDDDNKRVCQARVVEWHNRAEKYSSISDNSVHKISDLNSEDNVPKISDSKVEKTANSGIIEFEIGVTKKVEEAFNTELSKAQEKFGNISTISRVVTLISNNSSDYGEFYDNSGEVLLKFANKKNALAKHAQKALSMKKAGKWSSSHPLHTFRHEIGHAIQLEHKLYDPLWDKKLVKITDIFESINPSDISLYGFTTLDEFISECIAESMTKKARYISKQIANIIVGG